MGNIATLVKNYMGKLACLTLLLMTLNGCKETTAFEAKPVATVKDSTEAIDVALKFINSYVHYLNDVNANLRWDEWVGTNPHASQSLKNLARVLFDEGRSENQEMGTDFDPLLDAQDYPDEFEVESMDAETGIVIVRGKHWKEFRLAMKLNKERGKWLVDGCGVVNVPQERRVIR